MRAAIQTEGEQAVQQCWRIAYHPMPIILAASPKPGGYVHDRLPGSLWCLAGLHRSYADRQAIIICPSTEIGQGGELVDRVAGMIVPFEGAIPPGGGASDQFLNLRMPEHLCPRNLDIGLAFRLLQQVDQGAATGSGFVCFEEPSDLLAVPLRIPTLDSGCHLVPSLFLSLPTATDRA
jgi:hypothetical protein